jgi:hypothetical protein
MTIVRLLYLIWLAVPAASIPRAKPYKVTPYKVTWYGQLQLPSLAAIDGLLTRRLGVTWVAVLNDNSVRTIETCEDVLAVRKLEINHLSDDGDLAWYSLQGNAVDCFALDIVRTAKPASKSYLGWFKFSRAAILKLPAGLAPSLQEDETKLVTKAPATCAPWGKYERQLLMDLDVDYKQADLTGDGWTGQLYLLARGDLNGDGIEDLLFERDAALLADEIDAATGAVELFIVTQKSAKACPEIAWSLRDWRKQKHP